MLVHFTWYGRPHRHGQCIWLILLVLQGVLPAAGVYLTRALVNSVVTAIQSGGDPETIRPALLLAVLMGVLLAGLELLRGLSNWVRTALSEQVRDDITDRIHQQSLAVDLAFYDLPEYYDHQYRASREASYRPVALLESVGTLLQNGITLAAMMIVLIPYGWWLPLVLLASTLPALYVVLRNARRRYAWQREMTTSERRTWYYNWLITTRENAAEVRLFDLGQQFRSNYQELRAQLREGQLAIVRQEGLSELLAAAIALLAVGGTMLLMLWRVLQGILTLGDMALIYQAFTQGQSLMRTLLQSVGQIYGNSLFLGDLFDFLALEPGVRDPKEPESISTLEDTAIEFRNVSFSYPGSLKSSLHEFNLSIPTGKTIAIVGSNGAGKSTFVKLLCRFYDPVEGTVELFGQDMRNLEQNDLRRHMSVLFQTPVQFNTTTAENIALGNLAADPSEQEIKAAAYFAGADDVIERLHDGYDALLGIWFVDGTDLSWENGDALPLRRALLSGPIVVLMN
ncbi:MAG: ABC transporter ATP-binding protein [Chloroflexota bacterium]